MTPGAVVDSATRELRTWLNTSSFKPGARLPSERKLMTLLGIGHYGINRAMGQLVSAGVVRREGRRLFYTGEAGSSAADFVCDLIVPRRSIWLKGFRRTAREAGIKIRIRTYEATEEAVQHMRAIKEGNTDGVVFDPPHSSPSSAWTPALQGLARSGVPVASIRQHCPGVSCVLGDHERAVGLARAHLHEGGCERLALATLPTHAPTGAEIVRAWSETAGSDAGRIAFYSNVKSEVSALADRLAGEWADVTGLVVYADSEAIFPRLFAELAKRKRRVPRDLAVICLEELPHLASGDLPVSSVAFDVAFMQEIAFGLVQRGARRKRESGLTAPATCVHIQPSLIVRASTSTHGARDGSRGKSRAIGPADESILSPADWKRLVKRPYSLTITATGGQFSQVDLSAYANRPLNFRKGWLGDLPLNHLGAGVHTIHGVPFNVVVGSTRRHHGALVFRSANNQKGGDGPLPSRLKIEIGEVARAIYVLHGCGYARTLSAFATYSFYSGRQLLGVVPLVALGQPPPGSDAGFFQSEAAGANIQDWWPDFPQIDFPSARRVPLPEGEEETGAIRRHVCLYTLEWKNPFPEKKVTHLVIEADPDQTTTLGVVAITALKRTAI